MRMGSIRLLCATQTRVPHCSHSQLNDGVDGNGTSSTRGQASTSRNSKSGMCETYTRNLFGSCDKSRNRKNPISLTSIPQLRGFISKCGWSRSVPLRSFGTSLRKEDAMGPHQSRRHLQQAEVVAVAAGIRVSGRKHAERIIFE